MQRECGSGHKTIYRLRGKSFTGFGFSAVTEVRQGVPTQAKGMNCMNANSRRELRWLLSQVMGTVKRQHRLCSLQHSPEGKPHSWNVQQGLWHLLSMSKQIVFGSNE